MTLYTIGFFFMLGLMLQAYKDEKGDSFLESMLNTFYIFAGAVLWPLVFGVLVADVVDDILEYIGREEE